MAADPEVQVDSEDAEYDKWLAALEEDDEPEVTEAEVQAEHEDDKALKVARSTQKVVSEYITEQKVEDMKDKFIASASDTAKELFAIYCTGNEDPKQLKRIMDLAKTKAAETEVDPEAVEKAATQKAQEAYGVSPLAEGHAEPPDEWEEARKRIREKGDTHVAFQMWNSLPSSGESSVQQGD